MRWLAGILERRRMRRVVPWATCAWNPTDYRARLVAAAMRENIRAAMEAQRLMILAQYERARAVSAAAAAAATRLARDQQREQERQTALQQQLRGAPR